MTALDNFVAVIWEARAKPGCEAQMRAFLTAAVTQSRADPGCIDYEMHEVAGAAGVFIAYERWVSRDALDSHLNAPRMRELVPQLQSLMEGSIEEGLRVMQRLRPS